MEYVPGVSLTEFCDSQRLNTNARIELMVRVSEGVQHAHEQGIIHRDLKPSNILVTLHNDQAVPKIIDFGIAKALTGPLSDYTFATELHHPVGTAAYMSLEQWEAGTLDLDARTDVYSLGVILYELLVGVLPYDPALLTRMGTSAPTLVRDTPPTTPSRWPTISPAFATHERMPGMRCAVTVGGTMALADEGEPACTAK